MLSTVPTRRTNGSAQRTSKRNSTSVLLPASSEIDAIATKPSMSVKVTMGNSTAPDSRAPSKGKPDGATPSTKRSVSRSNVPAATPAGLSISIETWTPSVSPTAENLKMASRSASFRPDWSSERTKTRDTAASGASAGDTCTNAGAVWSRPSVTTTGVDSLPATSRARTSSTTLPSTSPKSTSAKVMVSASTGMTNSS